MPSYSSGGKGPLIFVGLVVLALLYFSNRRYTTSSASPLIIEEAIRSRLKSGPEDADNPLWNRTSLSIDSPTEHGVTSIHQAVPVYIHSLTVRGELSGDLAIRCDYTRGDAERDTAFFRMGATFRKGVQPDKLSRIMPVFYNVALWRGKEE